MSSEPQLPNVILAGIMCAGKSTVGLRLAQKLSFRHIDTDELLIKNLGLSPQEIIKNRSREEFQRQEALVIHEIPKMPGLIISLGSGSIAHENEPLRLQNLSKLRALGILIHLDASADILYERFLKDKKDTLRRVEDNMYEAIRKRRETRLSLHQNSCHLTIDTSQLTIQEVVELIFNEMLCPLHLKNCISI